MKSVDDPVFRAPWRAVATLAGGYQGLFHLASVIQTHDAIPGMITAERFGVWEDLS